VLDPSGDFFFLEMNTRLQVEHPVTELVTGLDLVELQLLVAQGGQLPAAALSPGLRGHAIEARVYAEDADYLPQTGTLSRVSWPHGVRVDSGVETGSVIGVHYDAMIAKVVAHGADRAAASALLADALDRAELHGLITNRGLLVDVLRSDGWVANHVDTGFLDRFTAPAPHPLLQRVHCLAAALAGASVRGTVFPSGWRNVRSASQWTSFAGTRIDYALSRDGLVASVDGEALAVRLWGSSPELVDLSVDGVRYRCSVHLGATTYVDSVLGHSTLLEDERFPIPGSALAAGSLTAAMPGTVLRVDVKAGDIVAAGDTLVVLEAMKMEHAVKALAGGTVTELLVTPGQQVEAGAVLAVVEEPT
jgi:propionyl-CoA carboxylase alpha chain